MTSKTVAKKRMGRPRKGTLEFRSGSWHARLTVTVEGESIRRWFDLGTDNKAVARRKMARLIAEHAAPTVEAVAEAAKRVETYAELAARVQKLREADGVRDAAREHDREEKHILPELGPRPIDSIRSEDITEIY